MSAGALETTNPIPARSAAYSESIPTREAACDTKICAAFVSLWIKVNSRRCALFAGRAYDLAALKGQLRKVKLPVVFAAVLGLCSVQASAQNPRIDPGGVVNPATTTSEVTPGLPIVIGSRQRHIPWRAAGPARRIYFDIRNGAGDGSE